MTWRVVVSTVAFLIMMVLFGFVLITESGRMSSFTLAYDARQVETGAALFQNLCTPCHGVQGKGIEGVAPAINAADLFDGSRLDSIGWTGTTADYLRLTISAGRPVPSAGTTYPQRMPTWGDEYGGPLRKDQVNSLVSFIMNWEKTALAEANATPAPVVIGFGTDITPAQPAGDAIKGATLATAKGCAGCHITAAVGPAWLASSEQPGIGTRAATRYTESAYTGKATSAEQYLVESIVQPGAHVAAGFNNIMPATFGQSLAAQDVADLVAYMQTLK